MASSIRTRAVWDDASGERVLFRDADLELGDLRVQTLD
jgi:hypothetical protein